MENANGTVKVGIGNLDKTVVENNRFGQVNMQSTGGRPANLQLILNFEGEDRDLGQIDGGELAGLMTFRIGFSARLLLGLKPWPLIW